MSEKINDYTALQKEIKRIKKRLTAKAKRNGIWENFGQKELNSLCDKYALIFISQSALVTEFSNWIENFSISDL